jgi:hypothetical protein
MPVILATQDVEIRGWGLDQHRDKHRNLSRKQTKSKRIEGIFQMIEHLAM